MLDGNKSVEEIFKLVYAFTLRSRYYDNLVDYHFSKIFFIMTAVLSRKEIKEQKYTLQLSSLAS